MIYMKMLVKLKNLESLGINTTLLRLKNGLMHMDIFQMKEGIEMTELRKKHIHRIRVEVDGINQELSFIYPKKECKIQITLYLD